jgi:hypothetical protein
VLWGAKKPIYAIALEEKLSIRPKTYPIGSAIKATIQGLIENLPERKRRQNRKSVRRKLLRIAAICAVAQIQ